MARAILTLLVMLGIGLHWVLIQGVAWVGMAVSYSYQDGSIASGLAKTFDGAHPCAICNAVKKGIEGEQEKAPSIPPTKLKQLVYIIGKEMELLKPEQPPVAGVPRPDYSSAKFSSITLEPALSPPKEA